MFTLMDIATLLQPTAARPCTTPAANVTTPTRHHTPTPHASTSEASISMDAVIITRIIVAITRTAGSVIIAEIIFTARTVTVEVECMRHTGFAIIIYFNRVEQTDIFTVSYYVSTATNTCLIEQPTGDCRRDDRLWCLHGAIVAAAVAAMIATTIAATIAPIGCGDDRPVYTPYYSNTANSKIFGPSLAPPILLNTISDGTN